MFVGAWVQKDRITSKGSGRGELVAGVGERSRRRRGNDVDIPRRGRSDDEGIMKTQKRIVNAVDGLASAC